MMRSFILALYLLAAFPTFGSMPGEVAFGARSWNALSSEEKRTFTQGFRIALLSQGFTEPIVVSADLSEIISEIDNIYSNKHYSKVPIWDAYKASALIVVSDKKNEGRALLKKSQKEFKDQW